MMDLQMRPFLRILAFFGRNGSGDRFFTLADIPDVSVRRRCGTTMWYGDVGRYEAGIPSW